MACMEHECTRCSWVGFDNCTTTTCPKCGALCSSFWDEEMFQEDDQERYEREQDDDALHGEGPDNCTQDEDE